MPPAEGSPHCQPLGLLLVKTSVVLLEIPEQVGLIKIKIYHIVELGYGNVLGLKYCSYPQKL